jgi:hypothetical protein
MNRLTGYGLILTKDRPDLSSERAPHRGKTATLRKRKKIWSQVPESARHQDTLTDRPSVVMWLWFWLSCLGVKTEENCITFRPVQLIIGFRDQWEWNHNPRGLSGLHWLWTRFPKLFAWSWRTQGRQLPPVTCIATNFCTWNLWNTYEQLKALQILVCI